MNIAKIKSKIHDAYQGAVDVALENNCIVLTGELDDWDQIVNAGFMCATKYSDTHVVNKIRFTKNTHPTIVMPTVQDDALDGKRYDVVIIGGGIIGCSIARELSKNKLSILLIEKESDVALHASSKNDGMIHPGIDLKKKSKKYRYNMLGNMLFPKVCEELDVDYDQCGQYVCFHSRSSKIIGPFLSWHFRRRPMGKVRYLSQRALREKEPFLSDKIRSALFFPTAKIVCPYGLTIAYAENAVENGVTVSLDTIAMDMDVRNGRIKSIQTNRGRVYPEVVINAAGAFAEDVAVMAHDHFFSIHPRKGTNSILDKKAKRYLHTIASSINFKANGSRTKGGGIVSTIDGNVLVGPDAVETWQKEDFSTDRDSIRTTFDKQSKTLHALSESDIITYFSGIRAPSYEEDFIIENGRFTENIVHAAAIQSPGLTAAPAIALKIEKLVLNRFSNVEKNTNYNPYRKGIVKSATLDNAQRDRLIKLNPNYGVIICRCEEISKGEIIDALHRPIPCRTLDGVKRRVRPGMGRCQGGFCAPLVIRIIAEELNIPLKDIKKSCRDSVLVMSETKAVKP